MRFVPRQIGSIKKSQAENNIVLSRALSYMKNTDSIVDQFAGALVKAGILISQSKNINWIEAFISLLPAKYPPSFMSLITRYTFDEFTTDKITFFANRGSKDSRELMKAILKINLYSKRRLQMPFSNLHGPQLTHMTQYASISETEETTKNVPLSGWTTKRFFNLSESRSLRLYIHHFMK